MGRCPNFLTCGDFDHLANSVDLQLSDDGVSLLGEIVELLALQILFKARDMSKDRWTIDYHAVSEAALSLGIQLSIDEERKWVSSASFAKSSE